MLNREQILKKTENMKKSFFCLVAAFIFFNFFLSLTLNLSSLSKKEENKSFITVELKNNISQDARQKLEQDFLAMPEIRRVTFYSRNKAFIELQKDLELSIPKGENPLPDTFFLYFKDSKDIEKIQEKIEKEEGVKEFFLDQKYIETLKKKAAIYKTAAAFSFLLLVVPSILLTLFIFQTAAGFDIMKRYIMNPEGKFIEKGARAYNVAIFIASSLMGTLIYFNAYIYLRRTVLSIDPGMSILSFFEILYYQLAGILLCNIAVWFNPARLFSRGSEDE